VTKFLAGMAVGLVRQLFMDWARRHAMLSVVSAQIIHFNYLLAGFSALARLFPRRISPLVIPHNDESRCEYKTQRGWQLHISIIRSTQLLGRKSSDQLKKRTGFFYPTTKKCDITKTHYWHKFHSGGAVRAGATMTLALWWFNTYKVSERTLMIVRLPHEAIITKTCYWQINTSVSRTLKMFSTRSLKSLISWST